jgi:hypothetical protein
MVTISLQMMDPNCKAIHASACTGPRSVEELRQITLESLQKTIPLNGLHYHLQFLSETDQLDLSQISGRTELILLLKFGVSPISYSKDWRYDPFNERVFLCFSIELKYGLSPHQTRC